MAVYSCDHFLAELHRLGSGPCELYDLLHTLLVEHIQGCMVEQKGNRAIPEMVDTHTPFLHDGHLL